MARAPLLPFALALAGVVAGLSQPAAAREVVIASAPELVSVTIYRDPNRAEGDAINPRWPQGFAMISETRRVTLPRGESTIRFNGVAEGMVAVSAIVTGLPGGTIEKNRNADLLSPAALVNGMLGNRVTITRTNPASGASQSESAVVRTRADGGLVLQTAQGYEAVRCSGLPEKLAFDHVPDGLTAQPLFTIDTRDASGGTYQITLTYLAWGFDWQAHYVATLQGKGARGKQRVDLRSWLTLLNDNGQSFADAELLVVAGALNVVSDFRSLADAPDGRPLRLTCYPIGSTSDGTPDLPPPFPMAPMAPMAMGMAMEDTIIVTAQRKVSFADAELAMQAVEENLGDLKLYRVPEHVDVAAQSLKQVAFLDKRDVAAEFFYQSDCSPWRNDDEPQSMQMALRMKNDEDHGLGVALPMGGVTLFEPSAAGELMVGEEWLRDYAEGQDVEMELGENTNVFLQCSRQTGSAPSHDNTGSVPMGATISNANNHAVTVRLMLGSPAAWALRKKPSGLAVKDGQWIMDRKIPAGESREFSWEIVKSTK